MADTTYQLNYTGGQVNALLEQVANFHSHITVGRPLSDNPGVISGSQIDLNNVTLAGEYEIPSGSTINNGPNADTMWHPIGLIVDEITAPSLLHGAAENNQGRNGVSILRQTIFRNTINSETDSIYVRYRDGNGNWPSHTVGNDVVYDWTKIITDSDISALETDVENATIGFDYVQYGSLAAAIKNQAIEILSVLEHGSSYIVSDFQSGYIWSTNGITSNPNYKRSRMLYPVTPFSVLHVDENSYSSTGRVYINFYDKDGNAISLQTSDPLNPKNRWTIFKETEGESAAPTFQPCIAPPGSALFGVSMKSSDETSSIEVLIIGSEQPDNIDSTFSDNYKSYLVEPKRSFANNSALLNISDYYDLIILPTRGNVSSLYLSGGSGSHFVTSIDEIDPTSSSGWSASVLTGVQIPRLEVYQQGEDQTKWYEYNSRRFTIPDSSKLLIIQLPRTESGADPDYRQIGVDGENLCYINVARRNRKGKLVGKNVLCIGDSNTYLDQRSTANVLSTNVGPFTGWQKALRYAGANITTLGGNGYTFAENAGGLGSLYSRIVGSELDCTGYDYIVLYAGCNDVGKKVPIGDLPASADSYESNPETFCGAVNGIISYIKTDNPSARIYVVITPQHKTSDRNYDKARPYMLALIRCAEYWGSPIINLFATSGLSKETFDYYLYDGTHYNSRGMRRAGEIIRDKMEFGADGVIVDDSANVVSIGLGDRWEV